MIPISAIKLRSLFVRLACISMPTPHWMAAGLVVANSRAASAIFSLGTQVTCSTLSNGHSLTRSTNGSQPCT